MSCEGFGRVGLGLGPGTIGLSEDKLQIAREAASIAMSDLSTAVVTEFTSLSGIMARHYALRKGYSQQVSEALFEITLPRFSGDIIPETDARTVLSIADRLDSLVGLFGAGCQSSSSNDLFGLRRISYGLVGAGTMNPLQIHMNKTCSTKNMRSPNTSNVEQL
ncbi:hypothetical protein QVD17_20404 [Tagetes erecta]|uniref:glycine--tRNA ligase n=1 Tax=Tagetes erecta TaxID=13708 RepID=A0AAD8KL55_TARER|nr:hypothetical protein QVD17_20404 [Tagetes erecta]